MAKTLYWADTDIDRRKLEEQLTFDTQGLR